MIVLSNNSYQSLFSDFLLPFIQGCAIHMSIILARQENDLFYYSFLP